MRRLCFSTRPIIRVGSWLAYSSLLPQLIPCWYRTDSRYPGNRETKSVLILKSSWSRWRWTVNKLYWKVFNLSGIILFHPFSERQIWCIRVRVTPTVKGNPVVSPRPAWVSRAEKSSADLTQMPLCGSSSELPFSLTAWSKPPAYFLIKYL